MTNSLAQMQYVLETAGADGVVNYSYYSTTKAGNDWTWYPYIADKLFTSAVPTPSMPWRDPATATEGTLWGRITDAQTGVPLDNAMIQTGGSSAIFTDGNGYYVMTRLPAAAGGTCYTVTASRADYAEPVTHADIQVIAGEVQRADLALSSIRIPADFDNDGDIDGVDLRHLVVCLSGAGLPPISPECQNADLDKDNDVDQSDFATLQRCLSGNGTPVTTECQTR
jgi:hypothetical protein